MRILFGAHRYDYGIRQRGLSFEYFNFYEPLVQLGHDVTFLDLGGVGEVGVTGSADHGLYRTVEQQRPEVVFTFLFGEELSPEAIRQVTASGVVSINWFADDHWRFDSFTKQYAPSFSWAATTSRSALARYREIGYPNVIKTQWAAATARYRPTTNPLRHDVTFVGQRYGDRGALIDRLREHGLPVQTWGTGWATRRWHLVLGHRPVVRDLGGSAWLRRVEASTRCSQKEMVDVFSTSRVNLNLSDASQGAEAQIKGRAFEVPACGGFLLTGRAAELEEYYADRDEVVVFEDEDELVALARYYLDHEAERRRIARRGYLRTQADHTYEKRLTDLFQRAGLT